MPRPEDEPTEPLDDLPWAIGPGPDEAGAAIPGPYAAAAAGPETDEPTLELPIIGRFEEAGPAGPPGPGRRWLVGAGIAAALLVLSGGAAVAFGGDDQDPAGYREGAAPATHATATAATPAPDAPGAGSAPTVSPSAVPSSAAPTPTATAPLDGRTEAGFDLVNGAAAITMRTADLGEDLYRISLPADPPRVTDEDGRIRLFFANGSAPAVQVALNSRVRWNLRVGGGADLSTIDLSGARLAAVDLAGGATRITLTLPRPDGTLTVRMSGGVSKLDVHTADGVPVRVRLGSGAGQVILDGTSHSGVAAGALFASARWDDAVDRIDVDAVAGMSALTVGP